MKKLITALTLITALSVQAQDMQKYKVQKIDKRQAVTYCRMLGSLTLIKGDYEKILLHVEPKVGGVKMQSGERMIVVHYKIPYRENFGCVFQDFYDMPLRLIEFGTEEKFNQIKKLY